MANTPLGVWRTGQYTATYNAVACGLSTDEGYRLKWKPNVKKISGTNAYGETMLDGLVNGVESVQLLTTFKEWNTAVKAIIWPYGANGTFDGTLGVVGQLLSSLAKPLVLTAVASTPAATNGPVTLTAPLAILSGDNDLEMLFAADETDMEVIFDLLPYNDGTANRFFSIE